MPNRTTIADVARLAGVSTMTVSRVINAKGEVKPETRARVERAITQLEYQPSQAARTLTTRRSHTIGVFVPDITNPFFPAIVRGAEDVAWREGYGITLINTVENLERERAAFQRFEAHRVDGVIACSARLPDADLIRFLQRHPHSVLVNRNTPVAGLASSVEVDDVKGAHLAIAHLCNRGRRTVAMLAGPSRSASAQRRRWGAAEALTFHGHSLSDDLIEEGEPTEQDGRRAMAALLARRPDIDAVYAYNDVVAIGALEAMQSVGKRVPEDIALIGSDDIRIASLITPTLTTLRSDTYAIGKQAAELLFERLRGAPTRRVLMDPELIVRESAP